jgi:hypothetical protein
MMSKESYESLEHLQRISHPSVPLFFAATRLVRFFLIVHLAILCGVTEGRLNAQTACEFATRKAESSNPAKAPDNIADATKAALASDWLDPSRVDHTLKAFALLTSSSQDFSLSNRVLDELNYGDGANKGLYTVAMGAPDRNGQPTLQGLPDFVDMLAKANTLNLKAPDDEDKLFASTKCLTQTIFSNPQGKGHLVRINDSFVSKNNNVALRQLLEAYPSKGDSPPYASALEQFRAAFEMNADKLAKQIAVKIAPAKN